MGPDNADVLKKTIEIIKELARSETNCDLAAEIDRVYNKIKEIVERD